MTKILNSKHYDLEERTFIFAKNIRILIKKISKTIGNIEEALITESTELMNIFGAIIRKSET